LKQSRAPRKGPRAQRSYFLASTRKAKLYQTQTRSTTVWCSRGLEFRRYCRADESIAVKLTSGAASKYSNIFSLRQGDFNCSTIPTLNGSIFEKTFSTLNTVRQNCKRFGVFECTVQSIPNKQPSCSKTR